jgi:hypothetical protein
VQSVDGVSYESFSINPGLARTFLWASNISNSFEQYSIRKLSLSFKPAVSTTHDGSFAMGYEPDPADPLVGTDAHFFQLSNYKSGPLYQDMVLNIPVTGSHSRGKLFTRAGSVPDTDIKTYDHGKIVLYTRAGESKHIGDVFITYTIDLFEPQEAAPISGAVTADPDTLDIANPLGDSLSVVGVTPLVYVDTTDVGFEYAGTYQMSFMAKGTGLVNIVVSGSQLNLSNGNASVNDTDTKVIYHVYVEVRRPTTMTVAVTGTTLTSLVFDINKISQEQYDATVWV